MNYKYSTSPQRPKKCELLHDLLEENTTTVLEENPLFDHISIIQPQKRYDYSCFRKILEKHSSCKELFEKHGLANDGVYYLQLNKSSEIYQAYCSKNTYACGEGAWTLVMKLFGNENIFEYDSPLWSNTKTLHADGLYNDKTEYNVKLASYHNTPFTKICLGMKKVRGAEANFIVLNYTARSLYNVIADGKYRATNAGRAKWMSLVDNAVLQPHCNMEGFNLSLGSKTYPLLLRIGLVGNNEDDCRTPDSLLGFGFIKGKSKWSSGNYRDLRLSVKTKTFGYILVQ
ncbi:uncharacterized protein LOC114532507 [Dendronephthya gigantea]|uniref:uncharacterized protein LOC114532507 n=1 Tax=Dendronephthya gigantea TaxID=151771 RepID=UPI00106CCB1E|nr:uncharacterized protein LOC114532507 [Dendronephthya gigantea]